MSGPLTISELLTDGHDDANTIVALNHPAPT